MSSVLLLGFQTPLNTEESVLSLRGDVPRAAGGGGSQAERRGGIRNHTPAPDHSSPTEDLRGRTCRGCDAEDACNERDQYGEDLHLNCETSPWLSIWARGSREGRSGYPVWPQAGHHHPISPSVHCLRVLQLVDDIVPELFSLTCPHSGCQSHEVSQSGRAPLAPEPYTPPLWGHVRVKFSTHVCHRGPTTVDTSVITSFSIVFSIQSGERNSLAGHTQSKR